MKCKKCNQEFPKEYLWAYWRGKRVCQICYRSLRKFNGRNDYEVIQAYIDFLQKPASTPRNKKK